MIGDKWSSPVSDTERVIEEQTIRLKQMVGLAMSEQECREFITETFELNK